MRDALRDTGLRRRQWRWTIHCPQHLGKSAVQPAQPALGGSFALAVVLDWITVNVRSEVGERNLLREEQQENTGQMQRDSLHEGSFHFLPEWKGNLNHWITNCNQSAFHVSLDIGKDVGAVKTLSRPPVSVATMIMARTGIAHYT